MDYIEVSVNGVLDCDETCYRLSELGLSGFVIENEADLKRFLENNRQYWDYVAPELEEKYKGVSRVKFYLENSPEGMAKLDEVKKLYDDVTTAIVRDSDWENNWKQYYKPIEVGERLIIVPEWIDCDLDGRVPLRLDPGLLFGTGDHATTRMCLAALEKYAGAGKKALDLGCGSGILGIGALLLGCDSCVSCDIDPKAPDIVSENAALNGFGSDKISVLVGDIAGDAKLRKRLHGGYDIVLANIVSDVIIALAPFVKDFVVPNGVFITSGIIEGREDEVASALESNGLEITERHHEKEWFCFECRLR